MNIYNAIMKAADHLGNNPELFDFGFCRVPDCRTPGCAIGWIDHFMGVAAGEKISGVEGIVSNHLGIKDHLVFYRRMDELIYGKYVGSGGWRSNAKACADGLRLYAAKYHAPKLPDSVTAIFAQSIVHTKRQLEVMEAQP